MTTKSGELDFQNFSVCVFKILSQMLRICRVRAWSNFEVSFDRTIPLSISFHFDHFPLITFPCHSFGNSQNFSSNCSYISPRFPIPLGKSVVLHEYTAFNVQEPSSTCKLNNEPLIIIFNLYQLN